MCQMRVWCIRCLTVLSDASTSQMPDCAAGCKMSCGFPNCHDVGVCLKAMIDCALLSNSVRCKIGLLSAEHLMYGICVSKLRSVNCLHYNFDALHSLLTQKEGLHMLCGCGQGSTSASTSKTQPQLLMTLRLGFVSYYFSSCKRVLYRHKSSVCCCLAALL